MLSSLLTHFQKIIRDQYWSNLTSQWPLSFLFFFFLARDAHRTCQICEIFTGGFWLKLENFMKLRLHPPSAFSAPITFISVSPSLVMISTLYEDSISTLSKIIPQPPLLFRPWTYEAWYIPRRSRFSREGDLCNQDDCNGEGNYINCVPGSLFWSWNRPEAQPPDVHRLFES